ncbi:hypothetical protein IF1G_02309 [Cordyceps javanica]|uniref:Uncharacterized protein n=1 Tax=Cordyceps javanica TaxID=43265 RepID=A0A545W6A9_9HYPO|nr:hypothetical protein IF1G_02309 [Cordyceps javanica]TQW09448.1 hypothetical protein IF2G_02238 [Cordyceps javanica]
MSAHQAVTIPARENIILPPWLERACEQSIAFERTMGSAVQATAETDPRHASWIRLLSKRSWDLRIALHRVRRLVRDDPAFAAAMWRVGRFEAAPGPAIIAARGDQTSTAVVTRGNAVPSAATGPLRHRDGGSRAQPPAADARSLRLDRRQL